MRLLQLTIKNFRGLKGDKNVISFEKSDTIFLIGQNNIGKSTFLHAYEYFVSSKKVAVLEDFYNNDTSIPIEIEGVFLKEEEDNDNEELKGSGKNAEPEWIEKWVDNEGHIKIKKVWEAAGLDFKKYTFSPSEGKWVPNGFGGMASLFTKYAPQPIFIKAMEDEASLEEKINKLMGDRYLKSIKTNKPELYDGAVEAIKKLQSAITTSSDITEMNQALSMHFSDIFSGLKLKIEASKDENIKVEDAFKKNHTLKIEHEGSDRTETFLQNGHGVIRQALFNFIAFLNGCQEGNKKEYLILFEEPELFLHPKLIFKLRKSLYDLAQDSPYQVLCATHSPMMIDISQPHSSLIRVSKDADENIYTYQADESIFAATKEEKEQLQMINRMNPHLCEVFYADKVILVEGDTEAIVYREMLKTLYPNEEVFVLNTGSKMNIPFFQKILTHFHIEHYPIHDMDTKQSKDGAKNPAWKLNETIWNLVNEANKIQEGFSRRYVHNANFENAHHYKVTDGKNKPLSAYRFVRHLLDNNEEADCLKWLRDIMGKKEIVHDTEYLEANVKTREEIQAENESYPSMIEETKEK